jgi:hypothetical protein
LVLAVLVEHLQLVLWVEILYLETLLQLVVGMPLVMGLLDMQIALVVLEAAQDLQRIQVRLVQQAKEMLEG